MRVIDLRNDVGRVRERLPRAEFDLRAATAAAAPVVEDVRTRGLDAVLDATRKFDGVDLKTVRVPPEELQRALDALPPAVRHALDTSIDRVRKVHRDQMPAPVSTQLAGSSTVSYSWLPVARVGLYAPGGLAAYASSVVMNVVPAQTAGVVSLAVCSPPQPDTGLPAAPVMAACAALGVSEVYAVGGAQAIAMLAYGAGAPDEAMACQPADVVTGPGNIYVAAAKRIVQGDVGIDSEAGPTEIMILADGSADPAYVAADLLSQAEHEPGAAALLVTPSEELIRNVQRELRARLDATRHSSRAGLALEGRQSALVLVRDLEQGLEVVNDYAAEHLEVLTRNALELAGRVTAAGAIFVGPWSPVSLGDYCAGSNHVLPTSGNARHASGLSVYTFLRGVQTIHYDRAGLAQVAGDVVAFSVAEDLPAHGEAVLARIPDAGRSDV